MHIGFDISQTGPHRAGCGQFAHTTVTALLEVAAHNRYTLYPSFGDFYFDVGMQQASPYAGRHVAYGPRHDTLAQAAAFWSRPDLDAALGGPDLVHANNFWCPTQLRSARLVYTLYDLGFVTNPAWTTEENYRACFEGVSRASIHADWIVAISDASRRHYLDLFPRFPEERIRVVHPGSRFSPDTIVPRRPQALAGVAEGAFWLSAGTIEPRKNQIHVARAYARYLSAGGSPVPLVFAGGPGWLMDGFRASLGALGILAHTIFTGYVSDAELAWLYRNCRANVYMSHFEGFGLPILEGMQFGAPTIASNTTSMPEVASGAGLLLPPDDLEGLAQALLRLDRDPSERARLSGLARARAFRFDARREAATLASLYEEVAGRPKRQRELLPEFP